MSDQDSLQQQAAELFQRAYQHQMRGEFDAALSLYTRSIETFPSAEAYTFRGWTHSFQRDYERAIADCLKAIEVDPDFGNPYNDIGAYLIEQGKWEEAIPWFEKAMRAPRYEARCYPYFNLGRVYEQKRDWARAKELYRKACDADPRYTIARTALQRLQAAFN